MSVYVTAVSLSHDFILSCLLCTSHFTFSLCVSLSAKLVWIRTVYIRLKLRGTKQKGMNEERAEKKLINNSGLASLNLNQSSIETDGGRLWRSAVTMVTPALTQSSPRLSSKEMHTPSGLTVSLAQWWVFPSVQTCPHPQSFSLWRGPHPVLFCLCSNTHLW